MFLYTFCINRIISLLSKTFCDFVVLLNVQVFGIDRSLISSCLKNILHTKKEFTSLLTEKQILGHPNIFSDAPKSFVNLSNFESWQVNHVFCSAKQTWRSLLPCDSSRLVPDKKWSLQNRGKVVKHHLNFFCHGSVACVREYIGWKMVQKLDSGVQTISGYELWGTK